jgi:hypothetical protein
MIGIRDVFAERELVGYECSFSNLLELVSD